MRQRATDPIPVGALTWNRTFSNKPRSASRQRPEFCLVETVGKSIGLGRSGPHIHMYRRRRIRVGNLERDSCLYPKSVPNQEREEGLGLSRGPIQTVIPNLSPLNICGREKQSPTLKSMYNWGTNIVQKKQNSLEQQTRD
eukprot:TRINITY_DN419_c0_g1_i3.p2 TRINITY_DN419_c0_g1~~TRINITY_DN419_c0_g1_i3.p2  ORF type:complete len:140 (+),score=0.54 TRINITY_DN419_c0_g1_i3:216-635(+)